MARRSNDAIANYFEYGIDSASRTLYLGSYETDPDHGESGVDSTMAERLLKGLHLMDRGECAPITIVMNNPGGDVYHGLAIYDAIRSCQSEVTIQVMGMAMSMGCIILQAADHRIVSPNATLMWHPGTDGFFGHTTDFQKRAEESKRIDAVFESILLPRIREAVPNFSPERFRAEFAFDRFISAPEAIDLGLADSILET